MRSPGRLEPVFAVLLLITASAFAQVKETINVHLVEVPVIVNDRDGNPVRNLTAANFEVIDDGQKREVSTFDTYDFASPDIHAVSPLNPAARRSFLLLFDMSFSSPAGRAKALDAARDFVARGMQRRDVAAVATIDVERGFRMLTSFTSDRTALTAAIRNPNVFRSSDPLQLTGADVIEAPKTDPVMNQDASAASEYTAEIARMEKRLNDSYNRDRVERQIAQLGGVARTLRMLPGRKEVVFFSGGFDARLVQGRDARAFNDALADMDLVIHGEAYKTDSDARYGSAATLRILAQMAESFRGSDVVLNAVDIAGVRVQNDVQSGAKLNSNEGLYLVSSATGGEVFHNSNDITDDIERMLHRQEVVYVLGFRAPSNDDGKFHALKVRVNGVAGARVQHRAGYWDSSRQTSLERRLSNAEIVLNDIAQTDIGVATLAVPFPTAKNAQVPVIVEITGGDLLRGAKLKQLTAEVYVYAFDEEGVVRDRMFQKMTIDAEKAGEKLREKGIKYYATLSLPEGSYAIKTLVRVPETDRKGFSRADVVVPKPTDVALLPPLFIEEPGQWIMVKGGSHDATNVGYPFQINGESFIPSASVSVQSGQARDFAVFVYNAAPDEVAWEATVADAAGEQRAAPSLVKEIQNDDMTKMMFRYAPSTLAGGSGKLAFTIRKKGSADARQSSVSFKVQP